MYVDDCNIISKEALVIQNFISSLKAGTEDFVSTEEDTTRLIERLRRMRRRCVYGQPDVSTTTVEASIEEAEYTMRLSEGLKPRRSLCVYEIWVLMTTPAASEE